MGTLKRLEFLTRELQQRHQQGEFGLQFAQFSFEEEDTKDDPDEALEQRSEEISDINIDFIWRNGVHRSSEQQRLRDLQTLIRSYFRFEISALNPIVNNEKLLSHLPFLLKDYELDAFPLLASILNEKIEDQISSYQIWEERLQTCQQTARLRAEAAKKSRSTFESIENNPDNSTFHEKGSWNIAHDTHIGAKKSWTSQTNQDNFYFDAYKNSALLVVADGISISTAGTGDQASNIAVQVAAHIWSLNKETLIHASEEDIHHFILQVLLHANHNICETSASLVEEIEQETPMGTTILIGYVRGNDLWMSNLGDSRAYLLNQNGLALITGDQNLRGEKLRHGIPVDLTDNQPALIRYLGHFDDKMEPALHAPDFRYVRLLEGERILLCSDGLTDYAAPSHADFNELVMALCSSSSWLNEICWQLTIFANAAGGGDNITTLLATFEHTESS